ncbi:MAG TPA: ribosome assembly cofactor RimP [Bacteroidia bacterium]|nr:ribosome assembly cofactor RimP [Bacteroidia bacterium]
MITKEQIAELANEKLQGTSLFLVDIKVLPGNKIEVYVDGDNGIGINDCVSISRHIEGSLDREKEDFSLEVSSPDATKPIKMARQYNKHIGRDFEIVLTDASKITGTLKAVDISGSIIIETVSRENKPVGKGKINVTKEHQIQLINIKESKIKLKF